MEEVIICTESEGVDAEEKNRAIEREFIERLKQNENQNFSKQNDKIIQKTDLQNSSPTRKSNLAFLAEEYEAYTSSNLKEERLSDEEILNKLLSIYNELEDLQIEGEERFKLSKLYSTIFEIDRSNQILNLVKKMQKFTSGLLNSNEFNEARGEEEVKSNNLAAINLSISQTINKLNDISESESKAKDKLNSNIDFQIAVETKDSKLKFTSDFCEIEQNITNIENIIGKHDTIDQPTIKLMITKILNKMSKIRLNETDKMKESLSIFSEKFKSLNSAIFKNQCLKDSQNSDASSTGDESSTKDSHDSSNFKPALNEVDVVYKIAESSIYDMDAALAIISRLKGVKKIHEDSPNIQQNINQISQDSALIKDMNFKNNEAISNIKADFDKEFSLIFNELNECEKSIASIL